MKRSFVIAVSAVFFLIMLNVFLLFRLRYEKVYVKNMQNKSNVLLDEANMNLLLLFQNMIYQYENEAVQLPDFSLKNCESLDSFPVSSLIGNETVLFFRFRETNCDLCVNKFMELLKNVSDKFPPRHFVVLCSYDNIHECKTFIRKNNLNINIFNVKVLVDLPMEKRNDPYFFILNSDLKVQNVFIPNKNNIDNMNDYMIYIKEKYWP